MTDDRIVAVGLLTDEDLRRLGPSFTRVWPVDQTPCFGSLLSAIDDADREFWRTKDAGHDLRPDGGSLAGMEMPHEPNS